MGFSLTGAICSPVPVDELAPGAVMWLIDEILDFGYINRNIQGVIEGVTQTTGRVDVNPADLAGTAFISLMFKRYLPYAKEYSGVIKAPPFWMKKGLDTFKQVREFAELPEYERAECPREDLHTEEHRILSKKVFYDQEWPTLFNQFHHNKGEDAFGRKSDGFLDFPYKWLPCGVVAGWVDELWVEESTSRRLLETSPRAQARLQGWQGQLAAYDQHGAKLLLVDQGYPFL